MRPGGRGVPPESLQLLRRQTTAVRAKREEIQIEQRRDETKVAHLASSKPHHIIHHGAMRSRTTLHKYLWKKKQTHKTHVRKHHPLTTRHLPLPRDTTNQPPSRATAGQGPTIKRKLRRVDSWPEHHHTQHPGRKRTLSFPAPMATQRTFFFFVVPFL